MTGATMTDSALKTSLYDTHLEFGARMVDFAGWTMPLHFDGIKEEHAHTRTACSLFDVSHMGRLKFTGSDCESVLDHICTRNLADAEVGRSYYTHVCRDDGGILDDVIVSRFEAHWMMVCNAANHQKIADWVDQHRSGRSVEIKDETRSTAMIALQGPRTLEVAQSIVSVDLTTIKRYRFIVFHIMGMPITVYRSGYTGEDGFEVVAPAGLVGLLMPRLLGTREKPRPVIKPAGLGARDTLRIEAGMPLYGQELSEEWDPLTAGQGWCVDLSKDFVGVEPMRKLNEHGLPRCLVGLELAGRRIARQSAGVFKDGRKIGEVTSGTLSPTLGKSIAMALVAGEHKEQGTELEVVVGSGRARASVVKLPFYKHPKQTG